MRNTRAPHIYTRTRARIVSHVQIHVIPRLSRRQKEVKRETHFIRNNFYKDPSGVLLFILSAFTAVFTRARILIIVKFHIARHRSFEFQSTLEIFIFQKYFRGSRARRWEKYRVESAHAIDESDIPGKWDVLSKIVTRCGFRRKLNQSVTRQAVTALYHSICIIMLRHL